LTGGFASGLAQFWLIPTHLPVVRLVPKIVL
jgi:hypothetical protein